MRRSALTSRELTPTLARTHTHLPMYCRPARAVSACTVALSSTHIVLRQDPSPSALILRHKA
eukprot:3940742-Rhodomonas_salina.1